MDEARASGADLLWRIKQNLILPVERPLRDGSYLSRIFPSVYARQHQPDGFSPG